MNGEEAEKKLLFFQQPRFLYEPCYDIVEILVG